MAQSGIGLEEYFFSSNKINHWTSLKILSFLELEINQSNSDRMNSNKDTLIPLN